MSSDVWGKVYGDLWCHPKFITMPAGPGWLWTKALSYSKGMRTYGVIGAQLLPVFSATPEDAQGLVDAGVWEETSGGWRFHDWDQYQTTRERDEEVSRKRSEAGRKGGRPRRQETPVTSGDKQVESKALSNVEASVKQAGSNAKAEQEQEQERDQKDTPPTPSQDTLLAAPESSPRKRARAFVYPDDFEQWWAVYPKKDDKRKALEVWRRVVREVPNDTLVEGAIRYRDDPNRVDGYTKLATTWLNAGAWENGPLPPRGGGGNRPQAGDTHNAMARSYDAAQAYRRLEDSGYYDRPAQITPLDHRRTA